MCMNTLDFISICMVGVFSLVAFVFLCIGILILLHHGWVHSKDKDENRTAKAESCSCVCYFQPSDVSHYEVWILTCFTNALCFSLGIIFSPRPPPLGLYIVTIGLCVLGIVLVLIYCRSSRKDDCVRNVSNHEIWIVLCFTNALSLLLAEHFTK
jgi:hypothetical protein